jgi:MFS family permease
VSRNRACFLADGVGWPLGQSFLSANTILPMFVARLAGNNFAVGLLSGIQSAGQFLPQLFASHWVERLPIARRYVVIVGVVVERLPILVICAAILAGLQPELLLVVFFASWAVMNLGTGVNSPAFFTMFSKSVPPSERAGITGLGNAGGTLLAAGGAFVARQLLGGAGDLRGYAWCLAVGAFVLIATVIPLWFVHEPREGRARTRSLGGHLRETIGLLATDRGFGVYVLMQVAFQFALVAVPFVTGYAVLRLGAAPGVVALGSAILLGSEALGSIVLGFVADRHGCRPAFVAAGVCGVLLFGVMGASPPIGVVLAAYVLGGFMQSALVVGNNMTMEFAPPRRTATYSAVVFSSMAPVRIAAPLALGAVADSIGTAPVFVLVSVTSALALSLAAFSLDDPRDRRASRPLAGSGAA